MLVVMMGNVRSFRTSYLELSCVLVKVTAFVSSHALYHINYITSFAGGWSVESGQLCRITESWYRSLADHNALTSFRSEVARYVWILLPVSERLKADQRMGV